MIVYFLIQIVLNVLQIALFWLPDVTSLPFGIEEALTFFGSTIKGLTVVLPFMELPWKLALFALYLHYLMWSWHWIKWFIERVR